MTPSPGETHEDLPPWGEKGENPSPRYITESIFEEPIKPFPRVDEEPASVKKARELSRIQCVPGPCRRRMKEKELTVPQEFSLTQPSTPCGRSDTSVTPSNEECTRPFEWPKTLRQPSTPRSMTPRGWQPGLTIPDAPQLHTAARRSAMRRSLSEPPERFRSFAEETEDFTRGRSQVVVTAWRPKLTVPHAPALATEGRYWFRAQDSRSNTPRSRSSDPHSCGGLLDGCTKSRPQKGSYAAEGSRTPRRRSGQDDEGETRSASVRSASVRSASVRSASVRTAKASALVVSADREQLPAALCRAYAFERTADHTAQCNRKPFPSASPRGSAPRNMLLGQQVDTAGAPEVRPPWVFGFGALRSLSPTAVGSKAPPPQIRSQLHADAVSGTRSLHRSHENQNHAQEMIKPNAASRHAERSHPAKLPATSEQHTRAALARQKAVAQLIEAQANEKAHLCIFKSGERSATTPKARAIPTRPRTPTMPNASKLGSHLQNSSLEEQAGMQPLNTLKCAGKTAFSGRFGADGTTVHRMNMPWRSPQREPRLHNGPQSRVTETVHKSLRA